MTQNAESSAEETPEAAAGPQDSTAEAENASEQLYTPEPGERQLTVRAVVAGCALGGLVSAMNIYFGLKTGWGIGGSLIAAILGISIFQILRPKAKFTLLEANITQTTGSGAGTMTSAAGLLSAIPALGLLGTKPSMVELILWGLSVAYLGVFFAVPLRKQMVVQEKLRFPTGTATAVTLVAMTSEGDDATEKARTLLRFALVAATFTIAAYFIPELTFPPIMDLPESVVGGAVAGALTLIAGLGFKFYVSPLMYGAGVLIGFQVAASLALGATFAWGVLGPWVESQGWVTGPFMSYADGARGWILWPGVAIMVADAMTSLALSYKTIMRTFKRVKPAKESTEKLASEDQISMKMWALGMTLATATTCVMAQWVFDIPIWMTLIAIPISAVLAMIATRSTGETDINPVGGMGKVTQLVFGGLAPGNTTINLMAAAISAAGASQAGDMMQDLKTGHLLGGSPRKQLIAQLIGVTTGIFFAVPIYKLFDSAYDIGTGDAMPAPAAHSWKAMAELLAQGFEALPTHAEYGIAAGFGFGVAMPLIRKLIPATKKYLPSGLAFGIAFIVPAFYSLSMFLVAHVYGFYKRKNPAKADRLGFAIASGLIAGEGLMGIVNAVLTLAGVEPLTGGGGGH